MVVNNRDVYLKNFLGRKTMTKTIILLFLLGGGFFISCSSPEGEQNFKDLHEVQIGMRKEQVHRIMRNPPLNIENPYIDTDISFY